MFDYTLSRAFPNPVLWAVKHHSVAPRAIAALCAAHPGPTPVFIEWRGENGNKERDENGSLVRLRSRAFRVDAADDLLAALRDLLGADSVTLVKA